MKIIGITSTAILSLLLGIVGPAYAQHEQQGEKQEHSKSQDTSHDQAKPQQQHAHQQPSHTQQQPSHAQQQPSHAQQQPSHAQQQQQQKQHAQHQQPNQKQQQQYARRQQGHQQPQRSQEQQRVQRSAWQEHRSQHWDSDHRNWQQRGGYNGYRIPEDRYRGYFGRNHGFRIYGLPFMVVGGYPRFQYEGYWISLVDPWPDSWGNNWYDNDDVYVAYVDNGYYLYNRRYPRVGIAISISM